MPAGQGPPPVGSARSGMRGISALARPGGSPWQPRPASRREHPAAVLEDVPRHPTSHPGLSIPPQSESPGSGRLWISPQEPF
jgi:hypothetical protein